MYFLEVIPSCPPKITAAPLLTCDICASATPKSSSVPRTSSSIIRHRRRPESRKRSSTFIWLSEHPTSAGENNLEPLDTDGKTREKYSAAAKALPSTAWTHSITG